MHAESIPSMIRAGDEEGLRRLLNAGADPNEPNALGSPPLTQALLRGEESLVPLLLAHGADPNAVTEFVAELGPLSAELGGRAPLLSAVARGFAVSARHLLEAGADPNMAAGELSLLAMAAFQERPELVALLLDFGAVPLPGEGRIIARMLRGEPDLARRVLEADETDLGMPPREEELPRRADGLAGGPDASNLPPLVAAARAGQAETVRLLLERSVEAAVLDHALVAAANHDQREIVEMLRARGAGREGHALDASVRLAVMLGNADRLRWLLELGAAANGTPEGRASPIVLAILYGQTDGLRVLIDAGADVNALATTGTHPLTAARLQRRPEMEALLIAAGASEPPPAASPDRARAMVAVREWLAEINRE